MTDERAGIGTLIDSLTVSAGGQRWIDTASQPAAIDRVGAFIANALASNPPDAIGCWLAGDDVVVAHAVAVRLNVPVLRLDEDLGLLGFVPDRGLEISTVAVVSPFWTYTRQSATIIAFLRNRGITVTEAVSLLPGTEPQTSTDTVPRTVLAHSIAPTGPAVGAHR